MDGILNGYTITTRADIGIYCTQPPPFKLFAMATITFDTHKFIKILQDAGFEPKQAEAVSRAFQEASSEAELATKRDIERVESQIREMKVEINGKLTLVQWMLALVVAAVVMPLLMKIFHS